MFVTNKLIASYRLVIRNVRDKHEVRFILPLFRKCRLAVKNVHDEYVNRLISPCCKNIRDPLFLSYIYFLKKDDFDFK